jgi:hypothetical protein
MTGAQKSDKMIKDIAKFDDYLANHVRPGTRQLYIQAVVHWAEFVYNVNNVSTVNNVSKSMKIHELNGSLNQETAQNI